MSAAPTTRPCERTQLLVQSLQHTGTRDFAANLLRSERPTDAYEPLVELLDDPNAYLRATVVMILGEFGSLPAGAAERLSLTANADRSLTVRTLAALVMRGVTVAEGAA